MQRVQVSKFNKNGGNRNAGYRDAFSEFSLSVLGFVQASKRSASEAGLTVIEYDLMLALSICPQDTCPNIAILCERLLIHHHVASETVGRLVDRNLLETKRNDRDRRSVTLILTDAGQSLLQQIAGRSLEVLRERGPGMSKSLTAVIRKNGSITPKM